MRSNHFYLSAVALMSALFVVETSNAQVILTPETERGVTINGVTWSTRNLSVKGKFMDNPWNYGLFYTFEDAQQACPVGWRLPTGEEFDVLVQAGSEWVTENNIEGRRFGSGENSVFFPAAGSRTNDTTKGQGTEGFYWSSTSRGESMGYRLYFYSGYVFPSGDGNYASGFSVRCVR